MCLFYTKLDYAASGGELNPKKRIKVVPISCEFSYFIGECTFDAKTSCIVIDGACEGVTCGDHATVKFTHRNLGTLNVRPLLDFSADGDGR